MSTLAEILFAAPRDLAIEAATEFLRANLFEVRPACSAYRSPATEPENATADELTPKELRLKYGLSSSGLHKRLAHPGCPQTRRRTGPSGRLVSVALTPRLDRWLSHEKRPGAALYHRSTYVCDPEIARFNDLCRLSETLHRR